MIKMINNWDNDLARKKVALINGKKPCMVSLCVLFFVFSIMSEYAAAHSKSDTIILDNGDRITGEIKSLIAGRLSLGTDSMGTLSIEWADIVSINSNYNYELRLENGQRHFGSVNPGSVPGKVGFQDVFGNKEFEWQQVVELRPVEDSFTDRLDIYLSANYSFTKASDVTQTEFRANISYEDEDALNSFTSRATVSDTDTQTTTSSRINATRRVWTDRKASYRQGFAGYETNDELALDYRITLGGGFGRYFIDSSIQSLNGSLSLQGLEEKSAGGETQESVEGVLNLSYSRWHFDTPELKFDLATSIYPSLTESGRVRADSSATLRWEIIDDLYWDMSAWGSYDSATLDDVADEFDWGLTTGLGWNF